MSVHASKDKFTASPVNDTFSNAQNSMRTHAPDEMIIKMDKKLRNKNRTDRKAKLDRRQAIATVMIQFCEENGDIEGLKFWYDVLEALDVLTVGGMSDEEDANEGNEQVRLVKDLDFRHPDFRALFKEVDGIRTRETSIFYNRGRKRIRRVYVSEMVSRQPPSKLPSSYYRPAYLELMKQGKVTVVKVNYRSDLSIPRHVLFFINEH